MRLCKTIHEISSNAEGEIGAAIVGGVAHSPNATLYELCRALLRRAVKLASLCAGLEQHVSSATAKYQRTIRCR